MKNLLLIGSIVFAATMVSCGGGEEEESALPTFCDCIKSGPIPVGCDKVVKPGMTDEEFAEKKAECDAH